MKRAVRLGLVVACCAWGVAAYGHLEWTGNGSNDKWTTCRNWVSTCCPRPPLCYPSVPGDDAVFPYTAGGWDCELVNIDEMGELTIEGNVDFVSPAGARTLEVKKLILDATSNAITITLDSNATIKAENP